MRTLLSWAKTGCTAHNASNRVGVYSYPPTISKDSRVVQLEQAQNWHEVQPYRSLTSEDHCSPWAFRCKECNLSSNYEKGPLVVTRCNLTKATPLSREADLSTALCELPGLCLGPSLLAKAPITASRSLAPSSICHMMQEHARQACGQHQNPQNSTMPSWNTACAATQHCTAHHEVTTNLGISIHPLCHHNLKLELQYLRHYLGLYARVYKGSIHKKWCWCETVFSPGSSLIKTHPGIEADNIYTHKKTYSRANAAIKCWLRSASSSSWIYRQAPIFAISQPTKFMLLMYFERSKL